MRQRLEGEVALVTGAAEGIGAACVRRLAAEGAAVVAMDVYDATAACEGLKAMPVHGDGVYEDSWTGALAVARELFGPVTILVSNATQTKTGPMHELTRKSWQRQLDINLTGTFLGVKTLLPTLRNLVVVSSVHALAGIPGHPAASAAKGALMALARQLAVEYGPALRVNTVVPAAIGTDDGQRTALKRSGTPEEVAAAVAFLASEDASFITGTSLVVDGGLTALGPG